MTPGVATAVTIAAGVAAFALPSDWMRWLFCLAVLLAYLLFSRRGLAALLGYLWWVVSFAVPAVLMHGFLNTAYARETGSLLRPGGVEFALHASSQLACGFLAALVWLSVSRPDLLRAALCLRLPGVGIAGLLQAFALTNVLQLRASRILDAQAARGLVTSGRWRRALALPSVVLPLVVSLLREAPTRARIQEYVAAFEARALALPRPSAPSPSQRLLLLTAWSLTAGLVILSVWLRVRAQS